MEYYMGEYEVAVIGAGHAGIEAALAAARLGAKTAIFTMSLDANRKYALQPVHRRNCQGTSGAGDRRVGRRDGQGGGCHLFAEQDAQSRKGTGGTQPAGAVGPGCLPSGDEAAVWSSRRD